MSADLARSALIVIAAALIEKSSLHAAIVSPWQDSTRKIPANWRHLASSGSRRGPVPRASLPPGFPRRDRYVCHYMSLGKDSMSENGKVHARAEGRIGRLIFDNPARRNAVSLAMWEAAGEAMARFAADDAVRVVVISGSGHEAFVSGADISRFENERGSADAVARYNAVVERTYAAVHEFPKPTVAMIRGYCIGGGLGLAVSCDIRIASETARFAMPAAQLGLGYDATGMHRFVEVLGASFTKEMFYTARQFDAEEARLMGLANRVVPDSEIETYARELAERIAENAPLTIAAVKFIVGELTKDEKRRDLARCCALVDKCFASRDYEEGRRAFMEKRKPRFTGS
jgi:enoyl-CoA hydratase/carnithine racemase